MSKVIITVMKGGKNVKALTYDNVRSVTIVNGGRRYLVTPTRIDVGNADGNSNVIRINMRSGSHDVPVDWDCKYIIVWYDRNDDIIAHADIDGRFVAATIRAWP
jgi:hypothetical protein